MPDQQDVDPVPVEELTPEEASRIIHSHRKVRYGTACWPCRQRKVKCDNKQPCENCVKREHPQLCSYKPNRSGSSKQLSTSGDALQHGRKRPHSPEDGADAECKSDHATDNWPRVEDDQDQTEVSRYVGQNSIQALLRGHDVKGGVDNIRQDMRPILGLDNSAPFPLMSPHHMERVTQDIADELPSDREVVKLFRTYKEITHPFWGFVVDIDDLESRLMIYLEERAKNAREDTKSNRPVSASWLAMLFAVLAVGSQYHDSPYHIRTRDSQKYIQISFHFLRLGNFLLRPTLDSIQALLMTSFVLLNDMKAEGSWALLGLTCRLAQSLGIHRALPQDTQENAPLGASLKSVVRRRLWWTCLWHDTLTSLSFDRPNMTNIQCCPIPLLPSATVEGWSYLEAMYHLCQAISEHLNPEATLTCSYEKIIENCDLVESFRDKVYPQLRSKDACKTALDRLQYFALRLHTSFVISVCCRPALRSDCTQLSVEHKDELAEKCKENLTETVRMYLAMHQLSVIPTRSWAFTYHGLSSAVLLGILTETKADPEVRQLQGDLISALSATAAKEQTSPDIHIRKTDKDIELSGPLSRALTALKNIYDHGNLHGIKSESHSGARTPLLLQQQGFPPYQALNTPGRPPIGFNRHQDAALAMAEMQNGNVLSDYPTTMPYQNMQQQVAVPDLGGMDPTTYMSPMDLYDSIFWESPDPWNTGVDSMNFDFMAQPPPGQPPPQQFYF